MGVVYRATQLSLNRVVALKLLAAELSDDAGFRARFQREGQLQAALDHDHIVTVYEAGQTEHGLFLAMRLIPGPTLKDLITRGHLDPRRSLRLLAQVAQALDEAHAAGLIHRDIKPQNILIGRDDHAYLADFGLVKSPDDSTNLTGTGQFIGTIDYVAPEQIQGQPATAASDCYALTAVLFECLTGQMPFESPNETATLQAHLRTPPPRVSELRPELPAALDEVIANGMAKDPAARPSSASEVVRWASRAYASASPQLVAPPDRLAGSDEDGDAGGRRTGVATRPADIAPTRAGVLTVPAEAVDVPAAPATAAPASAPARERERRPAVPVLGPVVVALAAVAIAAGFLLGHSGNGSTNSRFTNSATVGHLQLRYPSTWQLSSATAAIPGITFTDPLTLAPTRGGGGLDAGTVADAGGSTLLSSSFRAKVEGTLPSPSSVQLGNVQAYNYQDLKVQGLSAPVTVYAVPSTDGVATIACSQPTGTTAPTFRSQCSEVADTLRLLGVTAYPLGVSTGDARAVSNVFDRLNSAVKTPLASLKAASTPTAQASAYQQLAGAYRTAENGLKGTTLSPQLRDAKNATAAALGQIADGYSAAGSAASAGVAGAYTRASKQVSDGSTALTAAVKEFSALGYAVQQ